MLVSAAWIGPAVLGALNEMMQRRLGGGPPARTADLLFASGDWLLYAFLTPAVFAVAHRWPLSRPRLFRRFAFHLLVSLAFCAAWAAGGTALRALLAQRWPIGEGPSFVSWFFITLPFGVAVYLAMVGTEHAVRYFLESREREQQLARVSEQLVHAQFAALQAQVNPHFMFNTLNSVAVLVRDGEKLAATRIIEQFSDVLRRTLARERTHETPLADELDLVRQYVAIEQARFSDRLRPRFLIHDDVRSAAVPTFAVQHLVENAIRHGVAHRSDSGAVTVSARRDGETLEILVTDDGIGITPHMAGVKGHGIDSTKSRLTAMYGNRASLDVIRAPAGGTTATLRVPFRRIESA
jgi:signal transduction histidine kinase